MPCFCGDPYCPRCFPGSAEAEREADGGARDYEPETERALKLAERYIAGNDLGEVYRRNALDAITRALTAIDASRDSGESGAASRMMTNDEAAAYLGVKPQTLVNWRCNGKGPAFVRMSRTIRYDRSALDAFLEQRTVNPRSPRLLISPWINVWEATSR